LFRTLYRGVVTWNRTKKRNVFGQVQQRPRDRREWLQIDVPEWRVVSDDLWRAAHERLERARQNYLAGTQGRPWGRPVTGTTAKYLLTGIARCGVCGAGLTVRSRSHGVTRSFRYVCATHHYRGRAICANGLELRQTVADDAVLSLLEEDILRPAVVEQAVALALEMLCSESPVRHRRTTLLQQLAQTERKLQQLTAAVEQGGHLPALLTALAQREEERTALKSELEALGEVIVPQRRDRKALERALRSHLTDWRSLLRSQIAEARQVLETLLEDRLVFIPERDDRGEQCYLLRARFAFGRAFSAILRSQGGTSPTGTVERWRPAFDGISELLVA
jgi:site-specific DNA recombinase